MHRAVLNGRRLLLPFMTASTAPMLKQSAQAWKVTVAPSLRHFQTTSSLMLSRRHRMLGIDETKNPHQAVSNILYNTNNSAEQKTRHILQALVTDEPGVLSKVSGILAARGFNIDSLVVSATEVPLLSRMTIALNGADANIEQARKQLEDLVPVWAVLDFSKTDIIERELLLIKVVVGSDDPTGRQENSHSTAAEAVNTHLKRQAVSELTNLFGGKIVYVGLSHCAIELCAESHKIDGFIHMLKPFGIIEASRSGVMAIAKTPLHGNWHRANDIKEEAVTVDETQLPPG